MWTNLRERIPWGPTVFEIYQVGIWERPWDPKGTIKHLLSKRQHSPRWGRGISPQCSSLHPSCFTWGKGKERGKHIYSWPRIGLLGNKKGSHSQDTAGAGRKRAMPQRRDRNMNKGHCLGQSLTKKPENQHITDPCHPPHLNHHTAAPASQLCIAQGCTTQTVPREQCAGKPPAALGQTKWRAIGRQK